MRDASARLKFITAKLIKIPVFTVFNWATK